MWIGEAAERIRHQYALRTAVKEALDTLPAAVCYFNSSGSVKLCNPVMYRLFRKMAQSDLQSYQELKVHWTGAIHRLVLYGTEMSFSSPMEAYGSIRKLRSKRNMERSI